MAKNANVTMNIWLPSDVKDYIIDEFQSDYNGEMFYTLGVNGMKFFFTQREELDALRLALHEITVKWAVADSKKAVAQEVGE